ncbi:hypothetical protein [Blastococcus capsensis]|uniref:hypothetical protein n=1 Tax=Blastococcus capsensis TaxID=1564163 RepID=UPI002541C681|nr:hypothetical protein [Blastococcus capsensis]MDK3255302.1 hypothetical protein [Blastococcus capsensis]
MGSAAVIGMGGALFGLLVGFAPGVAVAYPLTSTDYGAGARPLIDVPWPLLAGIAVAVPVLAVAVTGITVRSRLPMVSRVADWADAPYVAGCAAVAGESCRSCGACETSGAGAASRGPAPGAAGRSGHGASVPLRGMAWGSSCVRGRMAVLTLLFPVLDCVPEHSAREAGESFPGRLSPS